jgi:adenine-specific DNA-methyltransferase
LNHPLAEAVIAQAKAHDLPPAEIRFKYADHGSKVSVLEPFRGRAGHLSASLLSVESLDQAEDHLILSALADDGQELDSETAGRLLSLPGQLGSPRLAIEIAELEVRVERFQTEIQRSISERNARFFELEADKLDGWADDLKLGLEREIKDIDRQIKEARRATTLALTLDEKLAGQKRIKALESQRSEKRRSLFDAQDNVEKQRDSLIVAIEGKLTQNASLKRLFTIRWTLD